ncbi:phosphatase PAP2 family protein [Rhodococcus kronopolitis]|uniref:Phosphatase PAP2 family protein n=1 Tax=Rhodococcus kronopolitis TaxID=1460226 RepID=A0ABV9FK38_9NOCA
MGTPAWTATSGRDAFDRADVVTTAPERSRWTAIVVGATSAVGVAAVYLLLVGTAAGQRFDQDVFAAATSAQDGGSVPGVLRLDVMTNPLLWICVTAVVLVFGSAVRRPLAVAVALAVPVLSVVAARALRLGVLDRPQLDPDAPWPMANTFPSGHVAGAMGVALGLVLIAPGWMRLLGLVPCAVWVTLVSRDIMGAGWHRLSDVAGSVLLATAVAGLGAALVAADGRRMELSARLVAVVGTPVATVVVAGVLDPRPLGVLTVVLAVGVSVPMAVFVSATRAVAPGSPPPPT